MSVRPTKYLFVAVLCLAFVAPLHAYKNQVGYNDLQALLGANTPDGTGIPVMVVEGNLGGASPPAYFPDLNLAELLGKNITAESGPFTVSAGHANFVYINFMGNSTSMASGISRAEGYNASDWLTGGFLNYTTAALPETSQMRVANHSYISDNTNNLNDIATLESLDFVVETDDFIQVVGSLNSSPVLNSSLNAIRVNDVPAMGDSAFYTPLLDTTYTSGRTAVDLVAPASGASFAAPIVAAAAAVLLETADNESHLSHGTINNRTRTINHAATSEVIKAILMAGADRDASGFNNYTIDTSNNLDGRYGAGQVNIYNSHTILTGGEQDSAQDGNANDITAKGFDYDPSFGGDNGSNDTASYYFTAAANDPFITASLVWNLDLEHNISYDYNATLFDLNLELWNLTTNTLEGESDSVDEVTEHLWQSLTPGNQYEIRVVSNEITPFEWDYALAWTTVPEPTTMALLGIAGGAVMIRRRRRSNA